MDWAIRLAVRGKDLYVRLFGGSSVGWISYTVKYVSKQTLSSIVLILTLIAMKSGIQAIHT